MEIGTSEITIGIENMPSHRHRVLVDYGSLSRDQMHAVPAAGDVLLGSTEKRRFARDLGRNREKSTRMAADALAPAGEGAALDNRQPFLALRFYICHQGEYPAPW
jgi:microcystin-dependent protein